MSNEHTVHAGASFTCCDAQDAPAQDSDDLDTDDEKDEVAQYEAWRERELQRIARDRQAGLGRTGLGGHATECRTGGREHRCFDQLWSPQPLLWMTRDMSAKHIAVSSCN